MIASVAVISTCAKRFPGQARAPREKGRKEPVGGMCSVVFEEGLSKEVVFSSDSFVASSKLIFNGE